eukprot:775451_1
MMVRVCIKPKRLRWMSARLCAIWICIIALIGLIALFMRLLALENMQSQEFETEPEVIIERTSNDPFTQQLETEPEVIHMQKPSQKQAPEKLNINMDTNTPNGITLLFVAGIEGTGHHLWLNITTTMSISYPNDVDIQFYHSRPPYDFSKQLRDCFCMDMNAKHKKGYGAHCMQVIAKLKQIYIEKYKSEVIYI